VFSIGTFPGAKVEGFILDKDCGIIVGGNSHSTVNREEL